MSFSRGAPVWTLILAAFPLSSLAVPAFAQLSMPGMDMPASAPANPWQVHFHTTLNLVADNQQGSRGGSKTFVSGMAMVMASRPLSDTTRLELNAILSPDPLMGARGYPLLLQAGETADGQTLLVDRQHPHDFAMGLTARVTHDLGDGASVFVEAGYPGEIAFGPQAFMHRPSGEAFPTAPISHHWLDSGHITMGEVTAGYAKGPLTLEVSQFTGREPDQDRYGLDPVHLDSTAARLSWRMNDDWSGQASWAHQVSPEVLEPEVDVRKLSLSLSYQHTYNLGALSSTLAWGRKSEDGGRDKPQDGWLLENSLQFNDKWTGLARLERVYNHELVPETYWVSKAEIGAVRTFRINDQASLGVGAVQQFNHVPAGLKPLYGDNPNGTVVFMTLKFHAMKM